MPVYNPPKPNTFCWPELASADQKGSAKFYGGLFGWKVEEIHMPDGDYTLFKLNGNNVGAMYQVKPERIAAGVMPHWNLYVAAADVNDTVKRVKAAGGKVLQEPFDAAGDVMANLEDSTGVKFCIWQSSKTSEGVLLQEIGTLVWAELYSNDARKSQDFYTKVFNWTAKRWDGGPMPYTLFHPQDEMGTGGMLEITPEMKGFPQQWMPYFSVDDVDKMKARVEELGGNVFMGPEDIPTVGLIAMATDPQGAMFAFIRTAPMM